MIAPVTAGCPRQPDQSYPTLQVAPEQAQMPGTVTTPRRVSPIRSPQHNYPDPLELLLRRPAQTNSHELAGDGRDAAPRLSLDNRSPGTRCKTDRASLSDRAPLERGKLSQSLVDILALASVLFFFIAITGGIAFAIIAPVFVKFP